MILNKYYYVVLLYAFLIFCNGIVYGNPKEDGTKAVTENDTDASLITVSIKNKGGYVLRTKHVRKNSDGTFSTKTNSFPVDEQKTYTIPRFSEVYLHAIAAGGWSKCALVEKGGCTIKCSRGSLNMHCYFTRKSCGHVRGIDGGNCRYALVKYYTENHHKPVESLDIGPADQGTILLKNSGTTDINHFQVDFLNGNMHQEVIPGTHFTGECLSITRLAAGDSCTLEYAIPENVYLEPVYHITTLGTGITHHTSLTMTTRSAYISYLSHEDIHRCLIKSDGTLIHCNNVLDWNGKIKNIGMTDFKLQQYGKKVHAYFVHKLTTVYVCNLDTTTGRIGSCQNAGTSANGEMPQIGEVRKIGFSPDGSQVYLGEHTKFSPSAPIKPIVVQCMVNRDTGMFRNCRDSGARVPESVTNFGWIENVIPEPYRNRLYLVYKRNKSTKTGIMVCNMNHPEYSLSGCHLAANGSDSPGLGRPIDYPTDIAFPSRETAYIVYLWNKVRICRVDSNTGDFVDCRNSGADKLDYPRNVILDEKRHKAYFTNYFRPTFVACTINNDESLSACKIVKNGPKVGSSLVIYPDSDFRSQLPYSYKF